MWLYVAKFIIVGCEMRIANCCHILDNERPVIKYRLKVLPNIDTYLQCVCGANVFRRVCRVVLTVKKFLACHVTSSTLVCLWACRRQLLNVLVGDGADGSGGQSQTEVAQSHHVVRVVPSISVVHKASVVVLESLPQTFIYRDHKRQDTQPPVQWTLRGLIIRNITWLWCNNA